MYSTCELYVFCQFKHDRKTGVKKNLLQSLAPTLIKLTYLWFTNDLEDSD